MAKIQKLIAGLKESNIEKRALSAGDTLPSFTLSNAVGNQVDSNTLLQQGHLVITFYRGSWCPFCNLELMSLQAKINDIKALNANLVAITPEKPGRIQDSEVAQSLAFEVLTDQDNKLATECGLVFQLPNSIRELYKTLEIDIASFNDSESYELPVPATYVVRSDGVISYAFVDANYLNRAEPAKIIAALHELEAE